MGESKIIADKEGVHEIDSSTKNKIILISLVSVVFIISIGLIVWVVINENYYRETDVQVKRFPSQTEEVFVAETETQEKLLSVKNEIDDKENDISGFYEALNDVEADTYGELLIE